MRFMTRNSLVAAFLLYLHFANVNPATAQQPTVTPQHVHTVDLRLNQIQVIGTHNSYHIAPPAHLHQAIRLAAPATADSIDYTHRPLEQQLDRLHIRQIELDLYADPSGGKYSSPVGYRTLLEAGQPAGENPNENGRLDQPGMKIIHSPGFDYCTTVPTLIDALEQVRDWSSKHPSHVPIMILIELKESVHGPAGVTPIAFDKTQLQSVDDEIRSVFSDRQLITPDSVRGEYRTLRQAIMETGWPPLAECRGKIFFALDNAGSVRDLYLEDHPALTGRIMFVSVATDHPAAGFVKLNDPKQDFDAIQAAVRQGLIVRTRADADTSQARTGDTSRRDLAFASGAQFISTDYPEPDRRFSEYHVRLADEREYRPNPLSKNN